MNNPQTPRAGFERDLLDRLKTYVAARGASLESEATSAGRTSATRRRAPRLAFGGAVAAAAVAAVVAMSAGGGNTTSAYALETQDGGGLSVEVLSLSDAGGLEKALEENGIPAQVTWLPASMTCREPRFQPSTVNIPQADGSAVAFGGLDLTQVDHLLGGEDTGGQGEPLTIGIGNVQQRQEMSENGASAPQLMMDPASFGPDQTLVLYGSQVPYDGDPEGGSAAHVRIAQGPVGSCEPVPVGQG
jgi:hypothetical protein